MNFVFLYNTEKIQMQGVRSTLITNIIGFTLKNAKREILYLWYEDVKRPTYNIFHPLFLIEGISVCSLFPSGLRCLIRVTASVCAAQLVCLHSQDICLASKLDDGCRDWTEQLRATRSHSLLKGIIPIINQINLPVRTVLCCFMLS